MTVFDEPLQKQFCASSVTLGTHMICLSGPTLSSVHFCLALLAELLIFGGVVFGHKQILAVTVITVAVQAIRRRRCRFCREIQKHALWRVGDSRHTGKTRTLGSLSLEVPSLQGVLLYRVGIY
jgi:hypothetical protein